MLATEKVMWSVEGGVRGKERTAGSAHRAGEETRGLDLKDRRVGEYLQVAYLCPSRTEFLMASNPLGRYCLGFYRISVSIFREFITKLIFQPISVFRFISFLIAFNNVLTMFKLKI